MRTDEVQPRTKGFPWNTVFLPESDLWVFFVCFETTFYWGVCRNDKITLTQAHLYFMKPA